MGSDQGRMQVEGIGVSWPHSWLHFLTNNNIMTPL
jgi:hypothetical protein